MSVARFLAVRELRARWGRAALAAAVVAGAVALSVGLELLGQARERAVAARLDAAGPALRVYGAGTSAAEAAALRVEAALPRDGEARVRAVLGGSLRRTEARALLRDPENGASVIASADASGVPGLAPGKVVLGSGLAERSGARVAGVARVLGRSFVVAGVAEASGDASDFSVLVLARDVGDPAPNELRIFLEPGRAPGDAESALRAGLPDVAVVASSRGEVADGGLQGAIAAHRRAVQLVTAIVAVLAILVSTHLDVSERRRELALLAAVGVGRRGLAALVVHRAVLSAIAGAAAGIAVALTIAGSQGELAPGAAPSVAVVAVGVAAIAAVAGAAPVALLAARRDPVGELQES